MPRRKPLKQNSPPRVTIHLGHQEPDTGLGDLLTIIHLLCHHHEYLSTDPPAEELEPPRPPCPIRPRRRLPPPSA